MLWVLLNHAYNNSFWWNHITNMGDTPHWLYSPLRVLTLGHYAVDIFISLSGFCLALPVVLNQGVLKGGAVQFYWRRARRILPPYYFSMLFATGVALISAFLFGETWQKPTTWGVITHLLLIHDLFQSTIGQINRVLWSVAVEWRIYFLFPLIIWLWKKIGPVSTTAVAVVFSYLLHRVMQHTPLMVMSYTGVGSCPHYIGLFALGCLGAALAFGTEPSLQRLRGAAGSLWTVLILSLVVSSVTLAQWFPSHISVVAKLGHIFSPLMPRDYLVGLWAASLMAAAGRNPQHWVFRPLYSKPLVFLGTFAYSTYLIHEPILVVLNKLLLSSPTVSFTPLQLFFIQSLLGGGLALGISYLFHLAFERPFMSKPGQSAPRTERQAEVAAIVNPAP